MNTAHVSIVDSGSYVARFGAATIWLTRGADGSAFSSCLTPSALAAINVAIVRKPNATRWTVRLP